MKWIKCHDDLPSITKNYIIRNWITCKEGISFYCDSKNSFPQYCKINNLDLAEYEWLDESVNRGEGVEGLYDEIEKLELDPAFNGHYHWGAGMMKDKVIKLLKSKLTPNGK